VVVPALWLLAAAGWVLIALGLHRGLTGFRRRVALIAHVMTAPGVVLGCATLGFGSLYATIALAAEWWALIMITGLRPERLLVSGSLPRLAGWSALTVLGVAAGTLLVPPG
jgi:hypothetical protein